MTSKSKIQAFDSAMVKWVKATKDGKIDHKPTPQEYGLTTGVERWAAELITRKCEREMKRK
jgi:hypothetical protein